MRFAVILVIALASYGYGVATGHYRLFPFEIVYLLKGEVAAADTTDSAQMARVFEHFPVEAEVVMIGDSLTRGGLWNEFLPDADIANRGQGGDTTRDILRRMGSITSVGARTALIMAGINDIFKGRRVGDIFDDYRQIVEELIAGGADVIVQSTLECSGPGCGEKLGEVRALNRLLEEYARTRGLVFVDLNAALSDENGLKQAFTLDGVHLNGDGYREWVRLIRPLVPAAR